MNPAFIACVVLFILGLSALVWSIAEPPTTEAEKRHEPPTLPAPLLQEDDP